MSTLEKIVRPFVITKTVQPVLTPVPVGDGDETIHLEINRFGGSLKSLTSNFSLTVSKYQDQKLKEVDRTTHIKRVENPDDATQFVDVERIDVLKTKGGSGKNFQRVESTYNNED